MIRLDAEQVSRAEQLLELAGATALSLGDAEDHPVLEPPPGETPLWPSVIVRALFPIDSDLRGLRNALNDACAPRAIDITTLSDAAWEDAIRRGPRARRIADRIWLAPADDHTPVPPGLVHLELRMGIAFGTGEHPTTALCLEWLAAHLRPGTCMLDYGCGSGILAIAALRLGAAAAWAVDIEPQARSATRDNAELNGVLDRLWIGTPDALPPITADILIANILVNPLVQLAPALGQRVAPSGTIVLSGILEHQRTDVERAYSQHFDDFTSMTRDGWLLLQARRHPGDAR